MRKLKAFFLLVMVISLSGKSQSIDIKDPIIHRSQQVDVTRGNEMIQCQESAFIENKGQVKQIGGADASFVSHLLQRGNTNIYLLREGGIAYQFNKLTYPQGYKEMLMADQNGDSESHELMLEMEKDIHLETYRMDMRFLGANPNPKILNEGKHKDYFNYYTHNVVKVHHYEKVTFVDLYPGIDWVIYSNGSGIKYDFVLHPGADPSQIKLSFSHQEELHIDKEGNLIHGNRMGKFVEMAPVSFQGNKKISSRFVLKDSIIRFELAEYDHDKVLVIDPERIWGTYYGGVNSETAYSCATDAVGHVYISGSTGSISNIADAGHQNNFGGGTSDAFLVKFDSDGVREWATYYGGSNSDSGLSCVVDVEGNVYIAGQTGSNSGIAFNGHQNVYGGGTHDAFLVKFDQGGIRQWATYYGGGLFDRGHSCSVDNDGNVFLAGETHSTSAIAFNGHQNSIGGVQDAFLVKFNSNGVRQWATYYGGESDAHGQECAVDGTGNVYLAGRTSSTSGISSNGHQNVYGGGTHDAFLVKFNESGTRLWGTYYGGSDVDHGFSCAVDEQNNVYLSGETRSQNGIAQNGHQNIYNGGLFDAFLAKFDESGIRLWGTYYGGNGAERGHCAADSFGNVYLAGSTYSETDIAFEGHQNNFGGGNQDAFLAKFNSNGERQWATYYGGGSLDYGLSCAIDYSGNAFLAGSTESQTNISEGGHQNTYGGGWSDAFLVKFEGGCNPTSHLLEENACDSLVYNGQTYTESGVYSDTLVNVAGCDSIITLNLTINNTSTGVDVLTACDSYTWIDGNTYTSDNTTATQILTSSAGCDSIVTLNLTINNSSTVSDAITACDSITWIDGNTYTSTNNSAEYLLTNSLGCDSLIKLDLIINNSTSATLTEIACDSIYLNGQTFIESGTYTQLLNNAAGCDSVLTLNLTINNVSDLTTTIDGIALYANNSSATYQWVDCNNENAPIAGETNQSFTPHGNGSYAVILTENGCSAISDCVDITNVSIENSEYTSQIVVFPNPTNGIFQVNFPEVMIGQSMALTNILGKEMREIEIETTTVQFDISEFSDGIYLIKITLGDDVFTRKLIKQ